MKYFILATKWVELRGTIEAKNCEEAKKKAKEHWQIFDTPDNTVSVNTTEKGGKNPIISEYPRILSILHIENEIPEKCIFCGKIHEGKCVKKCPNCNRVHTGSCIDHYRSL